MQRIASSTRKLQAQQLDTIVSAVNHLKVRAATACTARLHKREHTSIQVAKAFELDDVPKLLDHAYRLA
jgi:hypothetical protein